MLFPYLLKVSFLLAIVTLGYRWMVQFESYSRLNRALLWLNVIAAWSLPAMPLPNWGPTRIQTEFHQAIPKIARAAPTVKHKMAPYNPAPSLITSQRLNSLSYRVKSMNLLEWAWIIYVTGVLTMLSILLFQVGALVWVLLKSPKEKSDRRLVFVRNGRSNSPYSFFRWIIINPDKYAPIELKHIIAHETEHAVQWHSIDLLISEIQRIVLWFNPFAWFHQRLVAANLEYLADRAVLESGFEKKQYQYSLVNAVFQKRQLPLTSSFAQSMLKNRIKMMNRRPSDYLALGKYCVLALLLYISSAFVAPYTITLVELAPSVFTPVVKTLVPEKKELPITLSSNEKIVEKESQKLEKREALIFTSTIDSVQVTGSKWILKKNGTLYWAISPLATLDDINEIRKEIKDFGAEMNINSIEYDPHQDFISRLTVHINVKTGGSSRASEGKDKFTPIEGESGYFNLTGSLGTGGLPETLENILHADYEKAQAIAKANESAYFEYRLTEKISSLGGSSANGFDKKTLTGKSAESIYKYDGIGKSSDNLLLLASEHRNSELYLDTKPITFTDLNLLSFDQLRNVKIIRDNRGKKYVLVYRN